MAAAAVVAAFASLATGGVLRADVLTLANGDKLKGTLIRNADGMITFKSDILGEITVPASKASVKVDPPPDSSAAAATTPPPSPAEKPKPKPTSFTAIDLRTAARAPERATKTEDTGWFNRIEFGFSNQNGRMRKTDIYLRTENNRRTPLTEIRFLNRYAYGQTEGIRSADSLSSSLRFRRTLTGRLFFQSTTRYDRDAIKLIQCDAEQGFGLGMNLCSTKTLVLAAGADAALRYRSHWAENANTPAAPHQLSNVINVFQDMTLNLSPRFSLTQDFLAVVAPANDNDYKFNFNAGLTGKMTDAFAITARVELEYDRSLPPDVRYNQRIITTLGYVF